MDCWEDLERSEAVSCRLNRALKEGSVSRMRAGTPGCWGKLCKPQTPRQACAVCRNRHGSRQCVAQPVAWPWESSAVPGAVGVGWGLPRPGWGGQQFVLGGRAGPVPSALRRLAGVLTPRGPLTNTRWTGTLQAGPTPKPGAQRRPPGTACAHPPAPLPPGGLMCHTARAI